MHVRRFLLFQIFTAYLSIRYLSSVVLFPGFVLNQQKPSALPSLRPSVLRKVSPMVLRTVSR